MGGGLSSVPMQIDKEKFRELVGGTFNDAIFDANAINGLLSREKLMELAQITDCFLSFEDSVDSSGRNTKDRVGQIYNALRGHGFSVSFSADPTGGGNPVEQICSKVEKSRCVILFLTRNYINNVVCSNVNQRNKVEYTYCLRKKSRDVVVPVVMEDHLNDSKYLFSAPMEPLRGLSAINFIRDEAFQECCQQLVAKLTEKVRGAQPSKNATSNYGSRTTPMPAPSDSKREEEQFYQWMTRCTPIEENRRLVYCAALQQVGVTNVHRLAEHLSKDPQFLFSLHFNDYDADAIALAVHDLGIGFTYKRDFGSLSSFESAKFVLKKALNAPEDHTLAANALSCATRICLSGPEMPQVMKEAGFCGAIIELIQSHLGDANSVEQAARCVAALCIDNDDVRETFGRTQVAFFLSRSMQSHIDSPACVESSCYAVGALCLHKPNRERLGTAGICEILTKAIIQHASHAGVAEMGCFALEQLQVDYFLNTTKIGQMGGPSLLNLVMQHHHNNPKVFAIACKTLFLLAADYDNRTALGDCICPNVVKAVSNFVNDANLAALGCQAIHVLIVGKAHHRDVLGQVGACAIVKKIIETHITDLGVLLHGSIAVYSLAKGSQQNISRMAGIQMTLRRALNTTPPLPDEVKKHVNEAVLNVR